MKPVLALVGRPNVGKSTLFNRLTKSRDAIVADFAGLTRDRHYGQGRLGNREYIVIDTGGFEPEAGEGSIFREMAKQTRQAVAEADVVLFVVDAREGLAGQDHDIAEYLRRLGKPCLLVANKAEGMREGAQLAEFYELGLGEVIPVSAAHGQGVRGMLDLALDALGLPEPEEEPAPEEGGPIKLAVAGRPNVGKSTLINTWLGEERLVAFDLPGTTRDAITVPFERGGQKFELIDTAGLRRKGKVFEAIEKFSVVKTLQAIESANVVLLLLDAEQGVTDQDAHIAGFILDAGRAVVLAVNKWDAVDAYQRELVQRSIESRLAFLKFAELHFISARSARALAALGLDRAGAQGRHAQDAHAPADPGAAGGGAVPDAQAQRHVPAQTARCAHRGGIPPIVVHGNSLEGVTDTYKRFLEGLPQGVRPHRNTAAHRDEDLAEPLRGQRL